VAQRSPTGPAHGAAEVRVGRSRSRLESELSQQEPIGRASEKMDHAEEAQWTTVSGDFDLNVRGLFFTVQKGFRS
jgi:hypothetical protein